MEIAGIKANPTGGLQRNLLEPGMSSSRTKFNFHATLLDHGLGALRRDRVRTLQVNIGKLCNQACGHCHVDAGPKRTEIMTWATMQKIVDWSSNYDIETFDITGGAPEMNPNFKQFVDACRSNQSNIISRCNLTILLEPGYEDFADWYASRQITLICSLPCYEQKNVEEQRGKGVFDASIRALQMLNKLGYGIDSGLQLHLVYNPNGAFLPPPQHSLESTYKHRLYEDFGIHFDSLFTITNLPISRFSHYLKRTGQYSDYMTLLADNFNSKTVPDLMCRHTISVDWLGQIYDCDFNQMLNIPASRKSPTYLWDFSPGKSCNQKIAVGAHCYGCTAGSGSSCGGALT